MPNVSCTVTGLQGYNGGWTGYSTTQKYAGYNSAYYTAILRFTTGAFVGLSDTLRTSIAAVIGYEDAPTSVILRWALCSSDANKASYVGTAKAVSDGYQLASGTVSFSGLNPNMVYKSLNIANRSLKANTTYYLFFWAYSTGTGQMLQIWTTPNQYVTLDYLNGGAWIDNGSGFELYQVYIDNGAGWDLCIPYIDNGSSWEICS
jgi:hypothetical protein